MDANSPTPGFARLHAAEDQVGHFGRHRVGEHAADRDRIGVGEAVGPGPDPAIAAHREAAPHGRIRLHVAGGDDDHLPAVRLA